MSTKAIAKYMRISPQKARLVANQIRGLPADKALDLLNFSTKKAAAIIKKVLESAIANAEHNDAADIDALKVTAVYIDPSPFVARYRARAKGRGARILKRSSHVTVLVSEVE